MNGATLPPWLSPWAGGLVYGQRVYKPGGSPGRDHLRPRLTIYTLGHENSAPILSWSEGVGGSAAPLGALEAGAGRAGGVRWERVPLDRPPWHLDVPVPVVPDVPPRATLFEKAEAEAGAAAGAAAWSGVVRGWAAGAALLALLVVVARLAEHFLDWKYILRRRRMQDEWQRADVRATCRAEEGVESESGACGAGGAAPGDLPPPYCALLPAPPKDSPPPPYDQDSCVQFVHKDGIPLLVFNRERGAADPAGRARVERLLRAAGVELAALPPAPPAARPDEPTSSARPDPDQDEPTAPTDQREPNAQAAAEPDEEHGVEVTADAATTIDHDGASSDGAVAV